MGGEELKWYQLAQNQLMSSQGSHFSPHSTAKFNHKLYKHTSQENCYLLMSLSLQSTQRKLYEEVDNDNYYYYS